MCDECPPVLPLFPDPRTREAKLTARQHTDIENGIHPLTGGPLHPAAPDDASPKDRIPRPFTCGECLYFTPSTGTAKKLYRCGHGGPDHPQPLGTRSAIPRWWPACADYRKAER